VVKKHSWLVIMFILLAPQSVSDPMKYIVNELPSFMIYDIVDNRQKHVSHYKARKTVLYIKSSVPLRRSTRVSWARG
jgi:hypothetical protein